MATAILPVAPAATHYVLRAASRDEAANQIDHAVTLMRVVASTSHGATAEAAAEACQWLGRVRVILEDAEAQP